MSSVVAAPFQVIDIPVPVVEEMRIQQPELQD
jgi:hypothetical protein